MILFSRSKISVGVRGVVCDLADTILKSTWFACADSSLITTICVCVLRSDFTLRMLASSKLDSRSGNIASMFNPALAPDAAGSAAPDFNFIFVIPESGMHRAHQRIGIWTIHHYCVGLQRVADASASRSSRAQFWMRPCRTNRVPEHGNYTHDAVSNTQSSLDDDTGMVNKVT
ncbi:hypothetical protein B0H14DRAFT_2603465 [Mycena olivaceomarginata]|nr:hypothetical protein B0H14DRAFT_2603465 [Mycena olivaceomarginata]